MANAAEIAQHGWKTALSTQESIDNLDMKEKADIPESNIHGVVYVQVPKTTDGKLHASLEEAVAHQSALDSTDMVEAYLADKDIHGEFKNAASRTRAAGSIRDFMRFVAEYGGDLGELRHGMGI